MEDLLLWPTIMNSIGIDRRTKATLFTSRVTFNSFDFRLNLILIEGNDNIVTIVTPSTGYFYEYEDRFLVSKGALRFL